MIFYQTSKRSVRDIAFILSHVLPLNVKWVTDLVLTNQNTSCTWPQWLSKDRPLTGGGWLVLLLLSWDSYRVPGEKKLSCPPCPGLISCNVIGDYQRAIFSGIWKYENATQKWKWEERDSGLSWVLSSVPWAARSTSSYFGLLCHPNILPSCQSQQIKCCFCWFELEFCDTTKHFLTNIVTLDVTSRGQDWVIKTAPPGRHLFHVPRAPSST